MSQSQPNMIDQRVVVCFITTRNVTSTQIKQKRLIGINKSEMVAYERPFKTIKHLTLNVEPAMLCFLAVTCSHVSLNLG